MKHILDTNTIFKNSTEIVKQVIEKTHSEFNIDDHQLAAMITPIIANAEFNRVQKELENERFSTLIILSRTLDEENISKVINALNYSLSIKYG